MGKYLELFRGEVGDLTEKTKLENKPYVAYSTKEGRVVYTVVPKPVTGPADNEIWYTTTDGEVIPNWTYYDPETTEYPGDQTGEITSNSYENGIGKITCKNVITTVAGEYHLMQSNFSKNLYSIILPNSVTSIGNWAFNGCSTLTSITIPESVTSIGFDAFGNCDDLTSITIPNSVTSIENSAFYGCLFTKDNFINNSSLDAEANDYWGATICDYKMDGVFVKDNVAVKGDVDTTSIVIPDGVTSIGWGAFSWHELLTSVTIPNSVTSIGDGAFNWCESLTSITFEGTMEEWNGVEKGETWNRGVPATYVQCTDGRVEL